MTKNLWIDITVCIEDGMVYWPGDISVRITKAATMEQDKVNVTSLQLSAHTSTHLDAPLHFIKDGNDVTKISLEALIGVARVIEISNEREITIEAIKEIPINKGDRLLFKTRHSSVDWSKQPFQEDYVYLSEEAANYLAEKEIACIGIDYLSIAEFGNGAVVHQILLKKNIVIIEGLKLTGIDEGLYDMICLPLKIKHADGSPARVVIRKIEN